MDLWAQFNKFWANEDLNGNRFGLEFWNGPDDQGLWALDCIII